MSRFPPASAAVFAIAIATMLPLGGAEGRVCGDPDRNHRVTVTDGINVLRKVADLGGTCDTDEQLCDCDANGVITVTDGIQVLRHAANLSANLWCATPPPACGDELVSAPEDCDGDELDCRGFFTSCTEFCTCPKIQALTGRVQSTVNGSPVANVRIEVVETGAFTLTDATGAFSLRDVPTSNVVATFPDTSQQVYDLRIASPVATAALDLVVEPFFATVDAPQVATSPDPHDPGAQAAITAPVSGAEIVCSPPPSPCRFDVTGLATPSIGEEGSGFHLYVFVTPVDPPGGGTFPQFPAVEVDANTGTWTTSAQIGGDGEFPAEDGDRFDMFTVVTRIELREGVPGAPLHFARAVDVPGAVHVSSVVTNLVVRR